ncbi:MAG: Aminoglycoside N(6')-acetyltransferase type 1 [Chlamydiae bacterium]|nr:Aminoglycoside N(6')-acetyltransferase type 1 [Chlamydiota bacterium]
MKFDVVPSKEADLVKSWLKQDYVAQYFYGTGLKNTLEDLELFINSEKSQWTHWLAYDGTTPFGYLMTSSIDPSEGECAKYCDSNSVAITLDLLIGDVSYLGRGLSHRMIQNFLKQKFSGVTDVFIDPAEENTKAIHIYEKAGFEKLEQFIPDWCPIPHMLMHLKMKK